MSCTALVNYLTTESGRYLADEVYRRVVPSSPIIKLIKKDIFPEGLGETIANLTYGRTAPTAAVPTWADVADSLDDKGCLPTPDSIVFGATARTFNLQNRAVKGPKFCAENLRTKFALRKQLDAITEVMAQYARIEWEIRYRSEYIRISGRKVICGATLTEGTGAGFPGTDATSILTQGMLNKYKSLLIRDGAAESALGTENGGPVLTLMTSPETSDNLIFLNADIRQDLRWGKPSELLAPFGVERSYRGFYHLVDHFAKRYTFGGGAYTEVPAWVNQAATTGTESVLNSSYLSAPRESSYIFDPMVLTARIPKPISNPGGNFKFDPNNYMGDFRFLNIIEENCNPLGTVIFPFATFAEGSEPVKPYRGTVFMHLRCDPSLNAISSCS